MKLKLFIAVFALAFTSAASAKQMVCQSGFQQVVLLEGGLAKILGFDFAGLPSAATWRCAGVSGSGLGWFSSVEHVCQSTGGTTLKLYTSTVGSLVTVQLYNGFGVLVFNGPCVLQNN